MSYVVTVRRPADAVPLTVEDVASALARDAAFSKVGEVAWVWRGANSRDFVTLRFDAGELSSQGRLPRSSAWLQALRRVADRLNARVHGEEGEDLTEAEIRQVSWFPTVGGVLLAAVMMPVMLLVLLVRVPWLLWKLLRTTR